MPEIKLNTGTNQRQMKEMAARAIAWARQKHAENQAELLKKEKEEIASADQNSLPNEIESEIKTSENRLLHWPWRNSEAANEEE